MSASSANEGSYGIICLVFNPFKIQGQIINELIALNEIKNIGNLSLRWKPPQEILQKLE